MRILKSELEKIVMEEVIKELHSNPKTRHLITERSWRDLLGLGKKGDAGEDAEDDGEEESDYRDIFTFTIDDSGRQMLDDIGNELQDARKILNAPAFQTGIEKAAIDALANAKSEKEAIDAVKKVISSDTSPGYSTRENKGRLMDFYTQLARLKGKDGEPRGYGEAVREDTTATAKQLERMKKEMNQRFEEQPLVKGSTDEMLKLIDKYRTRLKTNNFWGATPAFDSQGNLTKQASDKLDELLQKGGNPYQMVFWNLMKALRDNASLRRKGSTARTIMMDNVKGVLRGVFAEIAAASRIGVWAGYLSKAKADQAKREQAVELAKALEQAAKEAAAREERRRAKETVRYNARVKEKFDRMDLAKAYTKEGTRGGTTVDYTKVGSDFRPESEKIKSNLRFAGF